jgi:hemerythrin-like domain-containing protein
MINTEDGQVGAPPTGLRVAKPGSQMPSREQVLRLLRAGLGYDDVGRRLGVRPGLAYLIATGLPADGGDAPTPHDRGRPGMLASSQALANPQPADNPTSKDSVLRWIKVRVERDAPMRQAGQQRDALPGAVRTEGEHDVVDVLTRDHNRVNAMLEEMSTIPGKVKGGSAAQLSARKSIVDMITVALSQHEAVEERYLWPAVRELLPDGDHWADTALSQEREGKDILAALGDLDGDDDRFDELVEMLTLAARTHVAFEDSLFLLLRQQMSQERRRELGSDVEKTKSRAPTRPHPHAPDTHSGVDLAGSARAAGAAGGAMHRTRDALGSRPADRLGPPAGHEDGES